MRALLLAQVGDHTASSVQADGKDDAFTTPKSASSPIIEGRGGAAVQGLALPSPGHVVSDLLNADNLEILAQLDAGTHPTQHPPEGICVGCYDGNVGAPISMDRGWLPGCALDACRPLLCSECAAEYANKCLGDQVVARLFSQQMCARCASS